MSRRALLPALLLALTVLLSACGSEAPAAGAAGDDLAADTPTEAPADPGGAAGICLEGTTDCVDTPGLGDDPMPLDETAVEQLRRDAQALLGMDEAALGTDVYRIGRRGEEQFALTEDYVLGRITVELDEVEGAYVVTAATVELPDGPETFTAE
jgi:hypothetical protein